MTESIRELRCDTGPEPGSQGSQTSTSAEGTAGTIVQPSSRRARAPRTALAVAVLITLAFCVGIQTQVMSRQQELRVTLTARDMVQTRRFLVPHFLGEPRLQKPPLMYWLVAGIYETTGALWSPGAARFPTVVALGLLGALLYGYALREGQRRLGLFAAGILVTFMLIQRLGRQAETDITLILFVSLTVLTAVEGLRTGKTVPWLLAGLFMGLGFMTKGLAGIAMPTVAVLTLALWERRFRKQHLPAIALALLLAACIGLPWYAYLRFGSGVSQETQAILSKEVDAIASSGRHTGSWFYYLLRLPAVTLPWSAALILGVFDGWRQRRDEPIARMALAWLASTVLVLSCLHQKQGHYMLLAMPPAALIAAWWCQRTLAEAGWRRRVLVVSICAPIVAVTVVSLAVPIAAMRGSATLNPIVWTLTVAGVLTGVIGGLICRRQNGFGGWAVACWSVVLAGWLFLFALYPSTKQETVVPSFVAKAEMMVGDGSRLLRVAGPWAASCMYYAHAPTTYTKEPEDAWKATPPGQWALLSLRKRDGAAPWFEDVVPSQEVKADECWLVLARKPVTLPAAPTVADPPRREAP